MTLKNAEKIAAGMRGSVLRLVATGRGRRPAAKGPVAYAATSAEISDDGCYRYHLTRRWAPADAGGTALWVCLNPSAADARRDDPTVRKIVGFSRRWGYDAAAIVNLYAWRATDPAMLARAPDPVGPRTDAWIHVAAETAGVVVAAWGDHAHADRAAAVLRVLRDHGPVRCLGTTKAGMPRHPCRLGYETPLVAYATGSVAAPADAARAGATPEPDPVLWVTCPECGAEQEDMGAGIRCDACREGVMPSTLGGRR